MTVYRSDPLPITLACIAALSLCTGCSPEAADPGDGSAATDAKPAPADKPVRIHDGPNIVLISIDTLRADHLGCYGYDRPTSPSIDALAAAGTLFEDCSSAAPWTLPAHASLLTGRYPSRHGVISDKYRLSETTIANVLRWHGYRTAAIVNYLTLSDRFGLDRGFRYFRFLPETTSRPEPSGVAAEAEQWLNREHKRPFFLFLHFFDVHSDYVSLPNYEKQFVRDYTGTMTGRTYDLMQHGLKSSLTDDDVRYLFDLYDASIRQIDDSIRQVLAALESNGLAENTIVALTSDHGEQFAEHGSVLHGQDYYEESIRIPLILRGPGVPSGKRVSTIVSIVDVMPTLLALASDQIPISDNLDGIDLQPVWMGRSRKSRFLFAEADRGFKQRDQMRMVRNDRYKFHFDRKTEAIQLYDLSNDPGEQNEISSDHPDIVKMFGEQLTKFMLGQGTTELAEPLGPREIEKLKSLGYQ